MSKKESAPEMESAPLYKKYIRNEAGLIESFNYKFNEDGSINWKGCLNTKYIVLNKEKRQEIQEKYGRNFDELQLAIQEGGTDPEDIADNFKLILLAGIKEIAKLRGFTNVDYHCSFIDHNYVAIKCTINWIPNFENSESVKFSSLADAHTGNVKNFTVDFLNAIAENRAFVRAVRNFLNINVVGYDELGKTINTPEEISIPNVSPTSPQFPLIRKFEELNKDYKVSWESFKKWIVEKKELDFAADWKSINDVPKEKAYEILALVAEQLEKQKAKSKKEVE